MNASTNTESNPKMSFLYRLESAIDYDRINHYDGQDIDINSHIISYARSFENASFNEFSYHFDQEYTSTDI
ncbi:hypothetical protein I8748_15430 [Nostoc sp. CENA67]|uniref:Uncharacterized protein n=1 Tax=Amazonocrinis nigriterrae CENA67 TaxID=2794033 RepID=A0A8J7HPK6_9NOST|nr:hypothetical protein [Amazonocrinis nigriterrae]MBH8563563.1 hypothetical protein [Amazonocrinis nigriterrae CENA67]